MYSEDYLNDKGAARRLAQRINDYWYRNGKPWVRAFVVTESHGHQDGEVPHEIHTVRSNLGFRWNATGEYYEAAKLPS